MDGANGERAEPRKQHRAGEGGRPLPWRAAEGGEHFERPRARNRSRGRPVVQLGGLALRIERRSGALPSRRRKPERLTPSERGARARATAPFRCSPTPPQTPGRARDGSFRAREPAPEGRTDRPVRGMEVPARRHPIGSGPCGIRAVYGVEPNPGLGLVSISYHSVALRAEGPDPGSALPAHRAARLGRLGGETEGAASTAPEGE